MGSRRRGAGRGREVVCKSYGYLRGSMDIAVVSRDRLPYAMWVERLWSDGKLNQPGPLNTPADYCNEHRKSGILLPCKP